MVLTVTPESLIASLGERAITLNAVGGQLKATPARLLTDDDRALIREQRDALLALLTTPAAAPASVVKRVKKKTSPPIVPIVTEALPTGAHGECPVCHGRTWRLRTTPRSGGAWLWACASCADHADHAAVVAQDDGEGS